MLDTNICSYIIKGLIPKKKLEDKEILLSSIVVSELLYGAKKKDSKRLEQLVEYFIDTFEVVDFDLKAAHEYAYIRAYLQKQGKIIGAYDLQIAAHAKSLRACLVTNNEKKFRRIDGLQLENWLDK